MPGHNLEFTARVRSCRITVPSWIREDLAIKDGSVIKVIVVKKIK